MSDAYDQGICVGGQCSPRLPNGLHNIHCARHGARYARAVMEKQGWVCIQEYGGPEPTSGEFLDMVRAVHDAGVDLQRWMAGWDETRGTPSFGIWAPKVAAAILGTMAGTLDQRGLTEALRASKLDPAFANAVDAAWRLGGKDAAKELILGELPHLAHCIPRYRG